MAGRRLLAQLFALSKRIPRVYVIFALAALAWALVLAPFWLPRLFG